MLNQAVTEANRGGAGVVVDEAQDWIADTFEVIYWAYTTYLHAAAMLGVVSQGNRGRGILGRSPERYPAQDRLAKTGWRRHALRLPAPAESRGLVGRCSAE